jgi:hypothetical protein
VLFCVGRLLCEQYGTAAPAAVYFARVRVWQYGDPGDVLGILTEDITDNFGKDGQPLRR